jgi:hypothetical protein
MHDVKIGALVEGIETRMGQFIGHGGHFGVLLLLVRQLARDEWLWLVA